MKKFKPGQSVHIAVASTKAGVLTDVSALALTVAVPGGPVGGTAVAATRDSQGNYHGDYVLPFTTSPGIGVVRAANVVGDPTANALREQRFYIEALDF